MLRIGPSLIISGSTLSAEYSRIWTIAVRSLKRSTLEQGGSDGNAEDWLMSYESWKISRSIDIFRKLIGANSLKKIDFWKLFQMIFVMRGVREAEVRVKDSDALLW